MALASAPREFIGLNVSVGGCPWGTGPPLTTKFGLLRSAIQLLLGARPRATDPQVGEIRASVPLAWGLAHQSPQRTSSTKSKRPVSAAPLLAVRIRSSLRKKLSGLFFGSPGK